MGRDGSDENYEWMYIYINKYFVYIHKQKSMSIQKLSALVALLNYVFADVYHTISRCCKIFEFTFIAAYNYK